MWHTDDVEDDRSHIQGGGGGGTLLLKDLFSTQFVKNKQRSKKCSWIFKTVGSWVVVQDLM